jgi:hypothetical protein
LHGSFLTGNVIFYPKVDTLFAGFQALDKLDPAQKEALRAAAERTSAHLLEDLPTTEDTGPFCSGGGRVVTASEADVRDLKAAARPVYRQLETDPQTAAFISQIRSMKAGMTAPSPTRACGAGSTSTKPAPQKIPEGTYTAVGTKQQALRLGADDQCALKAGGARLRLEMHDGRWAQWESCEILSDVIGSQGTYTSTDKELIMHETCCGDTTLGWSFDGKKLALKITQPENPEPNSRFIAEHRWVKVS